MDEIKAFVNYIKEQCSQYTKLVDVVERALKEKDLSYEDREDYILLLDIIKSENKDLELAGEMITRLSKLLEKILGECDESLEGCSFNTEEVW